MKRLMKYLVIICSILILPLSCEPEQNQDPGQMAPIIELADNGQLSVPYEGGDTTIAYTIVNAVEGGMLKVVIPDDNTWVEASVYDTGIAFTIEENYSNEPRNEMLSVVYTYGDKEVMAYLNIVQENAVYDFRVAPNNCTSNWFSNKFNEELCNYVLVFETDGGNGFVYLDLFAPVNNEDMLPPEGEYMACRKGHEEGYALSVGEYAYSYLYKINADTTAYEYYGTATLGSSVKISRDGDVFNIRASLVDEEAGKTYLVSFEGELSVHNGLINSALTDDVDKTFDLAGTTIVADACNFGLSLEGALSNYWMIAIQDTSAYEVGQPVIYMEIFTPLDVTGTTGSLEGVYTADADYIDHVDPFTFIPGEAGYTGTWYFEVLELMGTTSAYVDGGPLYQGELEFIANGDGTYNLILNGQDDNYLKPCNIHVVIENLSVMAYDYGAEPSAASARRLSDIRFRNRL